MPHRSCYFDRLWLGRDPASTNLAVPLVSLPSTRLKGLQAKPLTVLSWNKNSENMFCFITFSSMKLCAVTYYILRSLGLVKYLVHRGKEYQLAAALLSPATIADGADCTTISPTRPSRVSSRAVEPACDAPPSTKAPKTVSTSTRPADRRLRRSDSTSSDVSYDEGDRVEVWADDMIQR